MIYFSFNEILNFKFKISFSGIYNSCLGIMELLPFRGFFVRELLTLALHGITGDSAGNYHLMDEEST
jgi:hypothetical protein